MKVPITQGVGELWHVRSSNPLIEGRDISIQESRQKEKNKILTSPCYGSSFNEISLESIKKKNTGNPENLGVFQLGISHKAVGRRYV